MRRISSCARERLIIIIVHLWTNNIKCIIPILYYVPIYKKCRIIYDREKIYAVENNARFSYTFSSISAYKSLLFSIVDRCIIHIHRDRASVLMNQLAFPVFFRTRPRGWTKTITETIYDNTVNGKTKSKANCWCCPFSFFRARRPALAVPTYKKKEENPPRVV